MPSPRMAEKLSLYYSLLAHWSMYTV